MQTSISVRTVGATLALVLGLVSCAPTETVTRRADPETCLVLFESLDRTIRFYPPDTFRTRSGRRVVNPRISRTAIKILRAGCTTDQADLVVMDTLASELGDFRIEDSGPPSEVNALQVGIVTGLIDEVRVAQFFGRLGYRYRSSGVEMLGRRIFIGPIRSEGAMEQAIDVARRAGFIAPYPARYTRF